MMRWIYFLILVLAAVVGQTTVFQVLWFRTRLGHVGPELLAAVAVFVTLHVRSGTDAALAGWTLGMALDLTVTGPGFGLLSLLYAAGCAGIYQVREAFFSDRPSTQLLLGLVFCLFVYELWAAYDAIVGRSGAWGRQAARAAAMSAYTAAITPLVCALLNRIRRLLIAPAPGRRRR